MANSPQFINTPRIGIASLTTANTNRDGTGTIVDLLVGATGGTRVVELKIKAAGTVADCLINLFIYTGGAWKFFDDIALTGKSPTTTVPAAESEATYKNLLLPSSSDKLGASITITPASTVNVIAFGGNLS